MAPTYQYKLLHEIGLVLSLSHSHSHTHSCSDPCTANAAVQTSHRSYSCGHHCNSRTPKDHLSKDSNWLWDRTSTAVSTRQKHRVQERSLKIDSADRQRIVEHSTAEGPSTAFTERGRFPTGSITGTPSNTPPASLASLPSAIKTNRSFSTPIRRLKRNNVSDTVSSAKPRLRSRSGSGSGSKGQPINGRASAWNDLLTAQLTATAVALANCSNNIGSTTDPENLTIAAVTPENTSSEGATTSRVEQSDARPYPPLIATGSCTRPRPPRSMTCGGVMTPAATTVNSAPAETTTTESNSQTANSLSADQSTNVCEDDTGLNGNDLEKATTCHHQTHTFQQIPRPDLRKSQSMGKVNVKKGITTRSGRFRQRRESRGGIGGSRGWITSGESDSEAFTGTNNATYFHK
jgi:hypothetical protein